MVTPETTVTEVRYRELGKIMRPVFYGFVLISLLFAANYIFGWGLAGLHLMSWTYYYVLIGLLLPFVFLLFPMRTAHTGKIPWYDWVAAFLSFAISIYFSFNALDMSERGWAMYASPFNFFLALVLCLLVLESARRTGGTIFFVVTLIFFIYPFFSKLAPGILKGIGFTFPSLVNHHAFGSEGLMGIPMKVIGELIIGFLLFAGLLIGTGAGDFFLNLAMTIAGHTRGGPAKVAVVGSAFFGSLSGSIFANIIGTGSVTIPAMKKIGFAPHYAGAVEACASTGGVLMPPVMGAVAFVMASLTDIPYGKICIAAVIPSFMYYMGLLIQVDAYAARIGLKGIPREELPRLSLTFKKGWHFLFVLVVLVWGLLYMRWEAIAAFYASGLLILLAMLRKGTRLNLKKAASIVDSVGKLLVETIGVILPIGLIVSGLTIGGMAPALTAGILYLSGGIPFFALLLGAVACYLLGMVGLITAAYIFLAVSLAPSLISVGLNMLAVHLFIIYYAMLAAITPPVAAGAFLAAGIAGAHPMKTGLQAMRMGIVIYLMPFFFVFEPSLVLQGRLIDTLWYFTTCVVGTFFICSGTEGYLIGLGNIGKVMRPILFITGVLIAVPEWRSKTIGAALAAILLAFLFLKKQKMSSSDQTLKHIN
jgi:TRAP transporter 4TM/12TM fusion protein